jgi:hypothetical protein
MAQTTEIAPPSRWSSEAWAGAIITREIMAKAPRKAMERLRQAKARKGNLLFIKSFTPTKSNNIKEGKKIFGEMSLADRADNILTFLKSFCQKEIG